VLQKLLGQGVGRGIPVRQHDERLGLDQVVVIGAADDGGLEDLGVPDDIWTARKTLIFATDGRNSGNRTD